MVARCRITLWIFVKSAAKRSGLSDRTPANRVPGEGPIRARGTGASSRLAEPGRLRFPRHRRSAEVRPFSRSRWPWARSDRTRRSRSWRFTGPLVRWQDKAAVSSWSHLSTAGEN
jgi:hypothetical protein